MAPLILDGRALAAARHPAIRARARAVATRRGRPPRLLILAFEGPSGRAPWIDGKLRACREAGVDTRTLVLPHGVGTAETRAKFKASVAADEADGVFVQFPFPPDVDSAGVSGVIPAGADIDVMRPDRVREYLAGTGPTPPLTVTAILALLDAHIVELTDEPAVVIAEGTEFDRMLAEALRRRGAQVRIEHPDTSGLRDRLVGARVVITSLARPSVVRSGHVAPRSVLVDGGYFNPGGRGDVDLTDGIDHLRALAPVPGGVGPMTVSALVDAVVDRAERADPEGAPAERTSADPGTLVGGRSLRSDGHE